MKFIKFLPALFIFAACGAKEMPKDFDYGKVENSTYKNSFFDFEIEIPEDWAVQSQEAMNSINEQGRDLIAGDDEKFKSQLKASEVNSANLLGVYQYELGSEVDYNPSFLITAENISKADMVANAKDYLLQARKLLQQSQLQYDEIDEQPTAVSIKGQKFYKMNASITLEGMTIRQIYYTAIMNDFAFNVIVSYINDEQRDQLMKVLDTMKFKRQA